MKIFNDNIRAKTVIVSCLASLVLLTGCGKNSDSSGNRTANNEFVYPSSTDLTTLDPAKMWDEPTKKVIQHVYEGLVAYDAKNQIQPLLAEKWEVSEDGTKYTFHLKKNVKFHNGKILDADDVKFSFERACNSKFASPTAASFLSDIVGADDVIKGKSNSISGIKVIDPQTVEITIIKPKSYFVLKLAYDVATIFPKGGVPTAEITNIKDAIGTGPYRFEKFLRGQEVSFAAFKDYHGQTPTVQTIKVPIVKDTSTSMNAYKKGAYDLFEVPVSDLETANTDPDLNKFLHVSDEAFVAYLELNSLRVSQFTDKRVRQAIAMAIDTKAIVHDVFKDVVSPANVFLPKNIPGYRPDAKGLEYNPEKAKQLLADAGYPEGKNFPKLSIHAPSGAIPAIRSSSAISIQLKKNLGIKVDVIQLDWTVMSTKRQAKQIPFLFAAWGADYFDPENFLSHLFATKAETNRCGYSNQEFDALCAKADVEPNQEERLKLYNKAEDILLNDAPIIPLFYRNKYYLLSDKFEGVEYNGIGLMPLRNLKAKRKS